MLKKDDIRIKIKAQKKRLSDIEKEEAVKHVFNQLEKTLEFKTSKRILIYHSLPDELSTIEFIDKWYKHKQLFLPRVNGNDLDILPFDKNKLQSGAFNIEEPIGDNIVDIKSIDMIIVPAVAYDKNGNRVGRGKGFYDRLLSSCYKTIKIGIGYDFQLVDNIDVETHDVPVDIIITENNYITVNR